jgi:hypothetical protein
MRNRDSRDWLQIVGLFGVIASLLFVGLQMKQDREIALSAIYQERTSAAVEYYIGIATNDATRDTMTKFAEGDVDLTPSEAATLGIVLQAGKQLLDNSHYQFKNGYLDEEHWYQIRQIIAGMLQHPVGRRVILDPAARPSFLKAVQKIDEELGGTTEE